jgi:hypothetical protein
MLTIHTHLPAPEPAAAHLLTGDRPTSWPLQVMLACCLAVLSGTAAAADRQASAADIEASAKLIAASVDSVNAKGEVVKTAYKELGAALADQKPGATTDERRQVSVRTAEACERAAKACEEAGDAWGDYTNARIKDLNLQHPDQAGRNGTPAKNPEDVLTDAEREKVKQLLRVRYDDPATDRERRFAVQDAGAMAQGRLDADTEFNAALPQSLRSNGPESYDEAHLKVSEGFYQREKFKRLATLWRNLKVTMTRQSLSDAPDAAVVLPPGLKADLERAFPTSPAGSAIPSPAAKIKAAAASLEHLANPR